MEKLNKTILSALSEIMQRDGYISNDSIKEVATSLKKSEAEVYGVATFYSGFSFKQPAKNEICVCTGTACFVLGGQTILLALEKNLGIKCGQTTKDGKFALSQARCFGCCSGAPVVRINGKIYSKMTPSKVIKIVEELKNEN